MIRYHNNDKYITPLPMYVSNVCTYCRTNVATNMLLNLGLILRASVTNNVGLKGENVSQLGFGSRLDRILLLICHDSVGQ